MKDEKYLFLQDSRDKKNVANSARKRRTHCGKGGRVKFPSDYLSKKELNAMSGECKSYKLNEPMLWAAFKSMPDDIKITYIKLIREKFGASDRAIGKMMLVNPCSFSQEMKRLGIACGKRAGNYKWDEESFIKWVNHVRTKQDTLPFAEAQEAVEEVVEETAEEIVEVVAEEVIEDVAEVAAEIPEIHEAPIALVEERKPCVPKNGHVLFEGRIEDILKTVGMMLQGADVKINLNWEVMDNG